MAKFTDYTQKTKPADADLLLIHDNAGAANKKTPFSGVWSWILDKLASAVISQLETTNKSIIPAINELNSKITYDYYDGGKNYNLDNLFINSAESPGEIIRYFRNLNLGTNTGAEFPINATTAIIIGDFQIIFGYQTSVYYRYRWGDWSGWKEI